MLQVARLAPEILEDATALVVEFLNSQLNADGGFNNRAGRSDLYYTVFGIEGLLALQQPLPMAKLAGYLRSFQNGEQLDLVHVACLARCWSSMPAEFQKYCPSQALLSRIETGRTVDGGYAVAPGMKEGSLYGTFMAFGAYQDLKQPVPDTERMLDFVRRLRDPRAGFQQSRELTVSIVPTTAGAISLLHRLGNDPIDPVLTKWLLSCFDTQGGFRPAPAAPVPDLLSTATALHALATMKVDLGAAKEVCLDFIDTLWTNRGGFYGHWEDSHADCEYTYYALLSLGHLSL